MIHTTLNRMSRIRIGEYSPRPEGWLKRLLARLGGPRVVDDLPTCIHPLDSERWARLLDNLGKTRADDEPLSYLAILDSNGLDDALRCCQAEPQHARIWRLFAVRCAELVQHLLVDQRSRDAIAVARRHADGQASDRELDAAREAAWSAAFEARDSVWDPEWPDSAAECAADTVAHCAAADAVVAARRAADYAIRAIVRDVTRVARAGAGAWIVAEHEARDALAHIFRDMVGGAMAVTE